MSGSPFVRWALVAALLFGMGAVAPPNAQAGELEDAKRAGHVGERFDGYLGLVDQSAPEWARRLVADINAQRRQKYSEIAAKNQLGTEQVAAVAGEKLVKRATPGEYVMPQGGGWVKR